MLIMALAGVLPVSAREDRGKEVSHWGIGNSRRVA